MDRVNEMLIVLVLDDREQVRYVVGTWLTRSGFSVIEASTGAEALELLDREHIDVALLDVNLPDMSGFDVAEKIRARPETAFLPIIHLTATAMTASERTEGLMRGADAYLLEPIEASELVATINAVVRRSDMRRRSQLTADRLRWLNAVTADVHAASSDIQVFDAVSKGASLLAAGPAVVLVSSPEGPVAYRWSEPDGRSLVSPVDEDLMARVLAPAEVGANTVEIDDRELADHPLVGAPFVNEAGEPGGAILVPADVENALDQVVPLLAQLGVAVALSRANLKALEVEHRIAVILQQNLLPQSPPTIEGVDIAFRYIAAAPQAEVGGDFFEAFALDDGTVAVAVGDVVGHSMRAATVMGELRHALRIYALDGYDPPEVIERLDRLIRRFHPTLFASAIYAVLDLANDELRCCNAGHLPLLLQPADGPARLIKGGGGLIGVASTAPELTVVPFCPRDRLLMFTDGLVERRSEHIDDSLQRFVDAAAGVEGMDDLNSVIDHLILECRAAQRPRGRHRHRRRAAQPGLNLLPRRMVVVPGYGHHGPLR
ncbi:MAG: SpoIIE family protein phosphatase [Acidimicrobiales bacterium]